MGNNADDSRLAKGERAGYYLTVTKAAAGSS
jgi:hypothetical protein